MKAEPLVKPSGGAIAPAPETGEVGHIHPQRRSWPWLLAAVLVCPCHLPILLAILGTGALGGAVARNAMLLFVGLAAAFGFSLWRAFAGPGAEESCPACRRASR